MWYYISKKSVPVLMEMEVYLKNGKRTGITFSCNYEGP